MGCEIKLSRLHGHIDLLTGFAFKSTGFIETGPGIPLLRGDNIAQGSLRWGNLRKWPSHELEGLEKYQLRTGDVVLAMDRPWIAAGLKYARLRDSDVPSLLVQRVARLRSKNGLLQSYLSLLIGSPAFTEYVLSVQTGTTIPHISGSQIGGFEFNLPPIEEQTRVASLIEAIEDRIDLLRQTNTTLEAIAQALFKSWFVDFDPVHAKAEGREPESMDAATAALFPSEFEDSELGPIPKGWQVARLSEHVDAERGLSYKGAGLTSADDGLPMHNLNSVLEGGGYKYAGIKYYDAPYKERHLVEAGDLIVANTEQGHHHRLIGFPAIVPHRFTNGIFSHHLYRVRAKKRSPVERHWLYYCLMTSAVRDQIIGCSNGSTVNMLKPAGLQIPQMVVPPAKLCRAFDAIAEDLRTKIESGVDRAETLAQLRDTLLPRLISGKLRLPETEAVEAALA